MNFHVQHTGIERKSGRIFGIFHTVQDMALSWIFGEVNTTSNVKLLRATREPCSVL